MRCVQDLRAVRLSERGICGREKIPSFSGVTMASPVDAQGNFQNNFSYQPGGPGDIVVVRLFYQWPVYVSLLGFNLSNIYGGKRLLVATAAFRNEPYSN